MKSNFNTLMFGTILSFSVVFQQCDLFTTREPEPPTQTQSTFNQPVTPEIVLMNFKNAITYSNVDNYIRCFSDSTTSARTFTFVPSVEVHAQFSTVFLSWTLEQERQYLQNLGQPVNGTPYVTFSQSRTLAVSSDSVVYSMDYTVFYPHRRAGVTNIVQGNMFIAIGANNQRQWSIYRWDDHRTVSDSTWSYWKAVFSGS